jgi:hypothetical protein
MARWAVENTSRSTRSKARKGPAINRTALIRAWSEEEIAML